MEITIDSELDNLEIWLKYVTRNADRKMVKKIVRATALEFIGRAIKRTPVDTGRARAGWTALMQIEGLPLPMGGGGSFNASDAQKGLGESSAKVTDDYVEVVNGVPYIVQLEYGSSAKEPAGMVRISLYEMTGRSVDDIEAFEDLLKDANRHANWHH